MKVYAGIDPVTGQEHYLREVVPAGLNAAKEAEKVRTRLLAQVDQQHNARTSATVNQLLGRYFELLRVEPITQENYESLARNHIRPLLGDLQVGKINGEVLDSFTRCFAPAAPAVVAASSSSIAPNASMSATSVARPTSARHSPTARSARSTPS